MWRARAARLACGAGASRARDSLRDSLRERLQAAALVRYSLRVRQLLEGEYRGHILH